MKVRIKSGECPSYLTVGKVYKVHRIVSYDDGLFEITEDIAEDHADHILCNFEGCPHLNGGSWEVVDE